MRAADMKDIKYLFTSCGDGTERGKGLSAILASKSGPALPVTPASALVSKHFVVYLASVLGVLCYLKTTNPQVSKAMMPGDRRLVWQKLQCLGTVQCGQQS